jgi:predicted nucleic acid-binding protein
LFADTDILSIFARIGRLDILNELFEVIVVSLSVKVELAEGKIDLKKLGPEFAQLTTGELKDLKYAHSELDKMVPLYESAEKQLESTTGNTAKYTNR